MHCTAGSRFSEFSPVIWAADAALYRKSVANSCPFTRNQAGSAVSSCRALSCRAYSFGIATLPSLSPFSLPPPFS